MRRGVEQLARSDRSNDIRARVWVLVFGLLAAGLLPIAWSTFRMQREGDEARPQSLIKDSRGSQRVEAEQAPQEDHPPETPEYAADDEQGEDDLAEHMMRDRRTWIDDPD